MTKKKFSNNGLLSSDSDFTDGDGNEYWKKFHENSLLCFGIACIISAIYLISPTIFTTSKSLSAVEGKIKYIDILIENVSSWNRYGYEAKSRRATLYFGLFDDERRYELKENIGQKYNNEKYLEIKRKLKRANNVTVWIKTKEQNFHKPKIFKIQADDKTVLTLNDVKTEYSWIFIFLIIIGFSSVGFVLKRKYPEKYERLIN